MSRQSFQNAPIIRTTHTDLLDVDGERIIRFGAQEWTLWHPDGTLEHRKHHESIVLVDGTNWNVSMLFGQNPVQIGACHLCRHPVFKVGGRDRPTHGLVRLTRAKTCCDCGALCCPKHRKRCSDGRYRCIRCARRRSIRDFFIDIFFARK